MFYILHTVESPKIIITNKAYNIFNTSENDTFWFLKLKIHFRGKLVQIAFKVYNKLFIIKFSPKKSTK